jgi:phage replication O-like protein O
MGVDKPNYTQIPNVLLDDLMLQMGEAELKVTLAIARQTFGYHRQCFKISLTDLEGMTKLSRQGVVNGVEAGLKRGTIYRKDNESGGFDYGLLVNEVDYPAKSASQRSGLPLVNEVDQASQRSGLEVVNEVDQYTPVLKKVLKKVKKESIKESISLPTPQQEMFAAVCEALGWDYQVISDKNKGQVAQTCGVLVKAGYTIDDLRRFMMEVWPLDWRWQKNKQYPSLEDLRKDIGKIRSVVAQVAPPTKTKGMATLERLAAGVGATR